MGQKTTFFKQFDKKEITGSILLLAVFVLPFFSYAKDKKIYVDRNYIGTEKGTKNQPYKTIAKALENSSDNTTVDVAKGTYRENIEIPSRVTVAGSENDEVIIEPRNDDKPVVKMKHKSQLDEVTVRKGGIGIRVSEGDSASISECIIKDNNKEGIKIESASVNEKHEVSITDNLIKNNGRNGILSEKRKIILKKNEITDNDGDGIGIMPGSEAWISGNTIKDNDKSGMRINLDNSNISIRNNTYRDNKREGVEIDAFGNGGRIDVTRSKFYENDRHGIVLVQKGNFSRSIWNGLTIQNNNKFWKNSSGNISPIIRVN